MILDGEGGDMGSVRRRVEKDGSVRYLALYRDLRGRCFPDGRWWEDLAAD